VTDLLGPAAVDNGRTPEATRTRLLDATRQGLTQFGAQKLSMSDVADLAGVSRPTLYRYFASKEQLLSALAEHESRRFDAGLAAALRGQPRERRLDVALEFVVSYLGSYGLQHLVRVESGFVLERIARGFPQQRASLARLIAESSTYADADGAHSPGCEATPPPPPERTADLVLRVAMSYFLIPGGDPADLLLVLRALVAAPRA
jgi:AcrR family transcriptional regulator